MKRKLLFMMLCIVGALSMSAQTDVTSTYLSNPSFEADGLQAASNGTTPQNLSLTGWTETQSAGGSYNDTQIRNSSTDNASNYGKRVVPSNGEFYLFYRHGWNGQNSATFTSSEINLAAGIYTLTVDYKMVSGSDNANNNNNTSITISAKDGDDVLGTATAKDAVLVNNNATTAVLTDNDWKTLKAEFTLESEKPAQIVINLLACGPKRSDFVVDNVKIFYLATVYPTSITLNTNSLSLGIGESSTFSATLSPDNATVKGVNWTSSDNSVATVSEEGVIAAIGPGTATITAKTENNLTATASVTVTDVEAAAAPAFYSTELSDGTDYYIYNAGTGKFLGGANDWGTHASIIEHGIPFTLASNAGVYTLDSHLSNGGNNHFVAGSFLDGAATNLYIKPLHDGKFSISTAESSAFFTAYSTGTYVNNDAVSANSVLAQWYFLSKEDRDKVLAEATSANPADATYYIGDANFGRNNQKFSSWTQTDGTTNNTGKSGDNVNFNWQKWNGAFDFNQTLSGLPNGLYELRAQGFYRPGANNTNPASGNAYLYAGDAQASIAWVSSSKATSANNQDGLTTANANEGTTYYVPNSQADASKAFSAGYYKNTVNKVSVTDGTLKIGAKTTETTGDEWTVIDNFELYYLGPTIGGEAVELPETSMEADKWYYFDIPAEADYKLSLTTLDDIVYTTDGTILIEYEATVTDHFSETEQIQLAAGRYYVKSASAQTLSIEPFAFVYEIGDAVTFPANDEYTQSSTILVTFPNAASNDPNAVLELEEGATATVNGKTVELEAVDGGFIIDLGTLTENTEYGISISPDVFGYLEHMANDDINFTIKTPAVFDGKYYLYNTDTKLYLSRGGNWATQAVNDNYGLVVNLVTDKSGKTTIQFADNLMYLGDDGFCYTDCQEGRVRNYNMSAVENGYKFLNTNNSKYLAINNGKVVGDAEEGGNLQGTSNVWSLEKLSDHKANYTKNEDAQALAAATSAGITPTTKAELEETLSSDYNATNIEVSGTGDEVKESYQGCAANSQEGKPLEVYTETVSGLKPGLYKLSVSAFQRSTWLQEVYDADGMRGLSYVYANDAKTQLKSITEYVANEAYTEGWNPNIEINGGNYPNSKGAAGQAFDKGEYVNDVYVYVNADEGSETGSIKFGIINPARYGNDGSRGSWTAFNNFTLTYYDQASATMAINASAQYGTFVAPFDVTIPEGVTAYTVDAVATNGELTLTALENTIPANTPVVVYSEAADGVNETFYGRDNSTDDTTEGLLTGVYAETVVEPGNYVLQLLNGKVAFYKVSEETDEVKVGANRAYLTKPAGTADSGIKAFFFSADDDTPTGISAIEALQSGSAEIYNAAGVKVPALQKGVNIIRTADGKTQKVLVK